MARGQRPLRGGFVVFDPVSLGVAGIAGCRCAGQDYLSGAATSLEGMARSAPGRADHHHRLTPLVFRRQSHLVAGEVQGDRPGLSCRGEIQRAPIDRDLARADAEKPAEVDDGRMNLAVAAHDDVHDPSHVLIGAAANALAEDGGDLLVVEYRRRACREKDWAGRRPAARAPSDSPARLAPAAAALAPAFARAASVAPIALLAAPSQNRCCCYRQPPPRSGRSRRQREMPDRYASVLSPVHANPQHQRDCGAPVPSSVVQGGRVGGPDTDVRIGDSMAG